MDILHDAEVVGEREDVPKLADAGVCLDVAKSTRAHVSV